MLQRFKIEDLVYQDASGVIFRAFDSETQQTVALRRFFPHGPEGDGLSEDEQVAYAIALGRLISIRHPALRSTVCGGCDPVDGIPYIATEWIDGAALSSLLGGAPLNADEAADLLGKALEVCQLLSEVLAEEAVWVETDPQTVIVGSTDSGRGVTFWISPFKWLEGSGRDRGLEPIIGLCEGILAWEGQELGDHAGKGLGGWLRWLRGAARATSLHEARENLAASLGVEPPVPARRLVRKASAPPPAAKPQKRASRLPLWILTSCVLFAIGGGTWALIRRNDKVPVQPGSVSEMMDFDSFNLESNAGGTRIAAVSAEEETRPEVRQTELPPVAAPGELFTPLDRERLIAKQGEEVILEGVLSGFAYSDARALMYLVFKENSSKTAPRGEIRTKNAPNDLSEAALKSLINQKIRLQGHVKIANERPVILITGRAAIQEVVE